MDVKETTQEDVKRVLGLTDVNVEEKFAISGQRPKSISDHTIDKTWIILGMTPQDFINNHGGDLFDFTDLKDQFKKICLDFEMPLNYDVKSSSVEFASKIIYLVGPASRSVKQKMSDKTWVFQFPRKNDKGVLVVGAVYVSTFKNDHNIYKTPTVVDDKLVLSVKHASLLALVTMSQITQISMVQDPPIALLTPLCGAIFSRTDVDGLAKELGEEAGMLVNELNESCQSGGHYLKNSTITTATVAAIVGTQKLAVKGKNDERMQIIGKIIKQYHTIKKQEIDNTKFMIVAKYATGGIPLGMEPKVMIRLFEDAKKASMAQQKEMTARSRMIASRDTEVVINGIDLHYEKGASKPGTSGKSFTMPSGGVNERVAPESFKSFGSDEEGDELLDIATGHDAGNVLNIYSKDEDAPEVVGKGKGGKPKKDKKLSTKSLDEILADISTATADEKIMLVKAYNTKVNEKIHSIKDEMGSLEPTSPEYEEMNADVEKLMKHILDETTEPEAGVLNKLIKLFKPDKKAN